ncbi:MAG: NUDIX hydrolase [Nanoarchaeota archaeon]|nr:NUDIX hydrolase [Nanoarchaeota archaeon]
MSFPIPVVRAILEDSEGRILLLRRRGRVADGLWCLPGGKVNYNQTVERAVLEEVKEETRLGIDNLTFLFYQDGLPEGERGMHCIHLYFSGNPTGTLSLNGESSEAHWVSPDEFRNYPIAFGNDEAVIQYLSEKRNHR